MRREIDDCRAQLGDLLQREVRDFAFPHGSHGRRERDYLASAGWASGAAVKNAFTHVADTVSPFDPIWWGNRRSVVYRAGTPLHPSTH